MGAEKLVIKEIQAKSMEWAAEDEFFQQQKARLVSELQKRRMNFEAVF